MEGCWIFRIQGRGFDKEGGVNSGALRPPLELCILPILNNFLTDIKIKYNENKHLGMVVIGLKQIL